MQLSDNPLIGDAGLRALLNVLAEDVWIKSIRMQNCGLGAGGDSSTTAETEDGVEALLACLNVNQTLAVFDVRRNPNITEAQMRQIRAQFVVELPLELDDRLLRSYQPAGSDDSAHQHPKKQRQQMAKFEKGRLSERIDFLEQKIQIEYLMRAKAEQLSVQLQRQLEEQQAAHKRALEPVPEGFLLVPTKQLNQLMLE